MKILRQSFPFVLSKRAVVENWFYFFFNFHGLDSLNPFQFKISSVSYEHYIHLGDSLDGVSDHRVTSTYVGQYNDKKETRTLIFPRLEFEPKIHFRTVQNSTCPEPQWQPELILLTQLWEPLCCFRNFVWVTLLFVFFRLLVLAFQESVMQLHPLHGNQLHVRVASWPLLLHGM
jgi:hypothetical protein